MLNWAEIRKKVKIAMSSGFVGILIGVIFYTIFYLLSFTLQKGIGDSYDNIAFVLIVANAAAIISSALVLIVLERVKLSYIGFVISTSLVTLVFMVSYFYSFFFKTTFMDVLLPLAIAVFPLQSIIIGLTRAKLLHKGNFLIPIGAFFGQFVASLVGLFIFFIPLVNILTYTAIFSIMFWFIISLFEELSVGRKTIRSDLN